MVWHSIVGPLEGMYCSSRVANEAMPIFHLPGDFAGLGTAVLSAIRVVAADANLVVVPDEPF